MKIYYKTILFFLVILFINCDNNVRKPLEKTSPLQSESIVKHADGFTILNYESHTEISIKTPWPDSDKTFTYALITKDQKLENPDDYDAVISIPVENIIVTSTTHIPSLEMLHKSETLVGFPNPDFISSEKTRERINAGEVTDVGQNESLNTEIIIDLSPDALIGFSMNGTNPSFSILEKAKIPVLYNADWTETTPLGKAEWIKFFGALYNKQKEADKLFSEIEKEYNKAKTIAENASSTPTVISGAMYKDIWHTPQGDSWAAQFFEDSNSDYIWKDSKGTGSLSLSLEAALEKGQDADFWIGPAQYTDLESLKNANAVYAQFHAFKTKQIYTYSLKKGETGGSVYFELASNRPDLVLKDHIKILHPELLPDYELYFYDKLN